VDAEDALDAEAVALVDALLSLVDAALADAAAAVADAAAAADVPTHQEGELAGMFPVLLFCNDVYRMPSVPTTLEFIA